MLKPFLVPAAAKVPALPVPLPDRQDKGLRHTVWQPVHPLDQLQLPASVTGGDAHRLALAEGPQDPAALVPDRREGFHPGLLRVAAEDLQPHPDEGAVAPAKDPLIRPNRHAEAVQPIQIFHFPRLAGHPRPTQGLRHPRRPDLTAPAPQFSGTEHPDLEARQPRRDIQLQQSHRRLGPIHRRGTGPGIGLPGTDALAAQQHHQSFQQFIAHFRSLSPRTWPSCTAAHWAP